MPEFINAIMTVVAFLMSVLMSGFIIIRDYLLPAKVKMFFGDSLQIVHSDRNKIQVNWNLTNSRNKLSVINKLEAELKSPNGNKNKYVWNIFYKFDGNSVIQNPFPTSIAVLAKSSVFQGIEFISDERFTWVEGRYEFSVRGWVNRGMDQKSNLLTKIVFSLNKGDVDYFNKDFIVVSNGITPMRPVKIIN